MLGQVGESGSWEGWGDGRVKVLQGGRERGWERGVRVKVTGGPGTMGNGGERKVGGGIGVCDRRCGLSDGWSVVMRLVVVCEGCVVGVVVLWRWR